MSSTESQAAENIRSEADGQGHLHDIPGTMTLVLIFLTCFVVYYFANWKALADLWHVQ